MDPMFLDIGCGTMQALRSVAQHGEQDHGFAGSGIAKQQQVS